MDEEWRPVRGFEAYEVSNLGRVRRETKTKGVHYLAPYCDLVTGYYSVYFRKDGITHCRQLAQTVWEAFVEPLPKREGITHIDGNKANNSLQNLRRGKVGRKRLFTPDEIEYIRQNMDTPTGKLAIKLVATPHDVTTYKRFIRRGLR